MPELIDVIKSRRSVRKFKNLQVSRDMILKLLDAARWAPSACNIQAWQFIVVTEEEIRRKLVTYAKLAGAPGGAPTLVYVLYDRRFNVERQANVQSAAAAIQNILLMAQHEGLGALWACSYGNEQRVREILGIPPYYQIVAVVWLGYPDETPLTPRRRPLDKIVHFDVDKWSWEEIRDVYSKELFATSPNIGFRPEFAEEMKREIAVISSSIGKNKTVLMIYNREGNHLFTFANKKKNSNVISYEWSREAAEWLKRRGSLLERHNIAYVVGELKLPFADKCVNVIICFQTFNHLAYPHVTKLIGELHRILKDDGKLYISFSNALSFYGYRLLSKEYKTAWHGLAKPRAVWSIRELVEQTGFRVENEYGVDIFPIHHYRASLAVADQSVQSESPKKLINVLKKAIVNLFIRINFESESVLVKGFVKNFCRLIIFECAKTTYNPHIN